MNTPPGNDAAPLAGGAGVNDQKTSPDLTLARLPLTPPVRKNAPDTSRIAAGRIAGYTGTLRDAVFGLLRERGEHGATDQEIQDALSLASDTEVPRRWELVKAGAVVASGRKRKTRSNCPATVWVAATPNTAGPAASSDDGGSEGGAA
jgi:hypothetical protein